MHFPTEHAPWIADDRAYDTLRRFCDTAIAHQVSGITLHTNQFVRQSKWLKCDVAGNRRAAVDRLASLDDYLRGASLWIGIENMPIIGTEGTDYDSTFVYPSDFAEIGEMDSPRIGCTWDICHWAVTYTTARSIAQLQQQRSPFSATSMPQAPIRQIHFASHIGFAMPFSTYECAEGVTPAKGDTDQTLLIDMVVSALEASCPDRDLGAEAGASVVFEVQEEDYTARKNCWETLDWWHSQPSLAALRRMDRD